MKLSTELRRWLKTSGRTQKQGAKVLGVSPRTFENWLINRNTPTDLARQAITLKLGEESPDKTASKPHQRRATR